MRGEGGRSIDEDPYAEKERLQKQVMRENPEDELPKIIAEKSSKIIVGKPNAIVTTCPVGTVVTTLAQEEKQVCTIEEVQKEEWKLMKPKGRQFGPRLGEDSSRLLSIGANSLSSEPSETCLI